MKFLTSLLKQESTKWILVLFSIPLVFSALVVIKDFDSPEAPVYAVGIALSLAMSLLYTGKIISSKQVLKIYNEISVNVLIFFISLFVVLFLLPFISWEGITQVEPSFWGIFVLSSAFYYLGKFFSLKAVSMGEISSVILLHSISPIVIAFFSFVILQEVPNVWGALGIIIIVVAIYILKAEKSDTNLLDPFKNLFKEKASVYMMITVLLFGATSNFDKLGAQLASAYEWVFLSNLFLLVMSAPVAYRYLRNKSWNINQLRAMYVVSIFAIFQLVFQMTAILYILVSYVTAIKVSSIVFIIIIGGLFFAEDNLKKKIPISFLAIIGVIIISLFG